MWEIAATGLVASFSSQWGTIQVNSAQNHSFWATRHPGRSLRVYFGLLGCAGTYQALLGCVHPVLYLRFSNKNPVTRPKHVESIPEKKNLSRVSKRKVTFLKGYWAQNFDKTKNIGPKSNMQQHNPSVQTQVKECNSASSRFFNMQVEVE